MQACELRVSIPRQQLDVMINGAVIRSYSISTSANGIGSEPGSCRTPVGVFRISEMIGEDAPLGAVFRSRVPTGEIGDENCTDDLVQTRILWLEGLEEHNLNTRERYIYIHGTNQEAQLGHPASHGCVRMANADIVELYSLVQTGTPVRIDANV